MIAINRRDHVARFAGGAVVLLALLLGALSAPADAPRLYHAPAFESPAQGDADDLLLLAGYGLASDDLVVYRAIGDRSQLQHPPEVMPGHSDAALGSAAVVSATNAPYSLTVKLPMALRGDQPYALWVRDAREEWSNPVMINDPRPLWFSPAFVYATQMPAGLPRGLRVIGRNLQGRIGHPTTVRLTGPQTFSGIALPDAHASAGFNHYVADISLPARLEPGNYKVELEGDGGWIVIDGQTLEVVADPPPPRRFAVDDARFGGCRPDDGADDSACIVRALEAAGRFGGSVYFGPGTWNLGQQGIVVPPGVDLEGAGADRTRLLRPAGTSATHARAAFTLIARSRVSGFTFRDLEVYQPGDRAPPFLQLGTDWQALADDDKQDVVHDVFIMRNVFDKPFVAIGGGGRPIDRLFVAYNTFGAYSAALELSGDQFNVGRPYRLDDSVIDRNVFKPGSRLDAAHKEGALASEIGAGYRVDFSRNTADGASTDALYSPGDARGWRAAFFWNTNNNVEEVLISQNSATCTGDKIGDGEAFAFDNNTNTFAFEGAAPVVQAGPGLVVVSKPLVARQHDRDVKVSSYYIGHWLQVVSGPGIGQTRKIFGYATDPATGMTSFRVQPDWDVVPLAGQSSVAVGREYWQLYVLDNEVDDRRPLCRKSNRSRPAAGTIVMWAQSADSVISGNRQFDSNGILVQQTYATAEPRCADCTMQSFFQYFLDIRSNIIDGEYDWTTSCSASGIDIGSGTAPWQRLAPPPIGFGVSVSHNSIRHADAAQGGAISQSLSWSPGPNPQEWPLSDNLLIHHNSISDVSGLPADARCGASRPRIGISFPQAAIARHTVLYANSCKRVSVPMSGREGDAVKVCPSSVADSCECAATPP